MAIEFLPIFTEQLQPDEIPIYGTRYLILVLKNQATLSIWDASDPSKTEV